MLISKNFSLRKVCSALVFVATLSVVHSPMAAHAQDADGCFATQNNCVNSSAEWKGEKFITRHVNNCRGRIWIRICNEFENGREDCGLSGLNPGSKKVWTTGKGASGAYTTRWVGSTNPNKDGVCGLRAGI